MKHLIFSLLIVAALVKPLGGQSKTHNIPERFQYFIESSSGKIEDGSNTYTSYTFDMETTAPDSMGTILMEAVLQKAVLVRNTNQNPFRMRGKSLMQSFSFGSYIDFSGRQFYETGYPVDPTSTQVLLLNFLEGKKLQLAFNKQGAVKCLNTENLQQQFDTYLSLNGNQLRKDNRKEFRTIVSSSYIPDLFNNLIINIPDDLKEPGDYSLVKRTVYHYQEDSKDWMKVEINRDQAYIDKENGLAWFYKKRDNQSRIILEKPVSGNPQNKYNTIITGNYPDKKGKQINCQQDELSLKFASTELSIDIDEEGNFSIPMNIQYPVFLNFRNGIKMYCEPGDNLQVTMLSNPDSLNCKGIGNMNNEYLQKKKEFVLYRGMISWDEVHKESKYFEKVDEVEKHNNNLLNLYKKDLSPRFYEHQFVWEYYNAINGKLFVKSLQFELDYVHTPDSFKWYQTIHPSYQTFTNNLQYNKFLSFNLGHQLDKIHHLKYRALNCSSNMVSSIPDFLQFAKIYFNKKQLIDFLAMQARLNYSINDIAVTQEVEKIANEKFPDSPLLTLISELKKNSVTTVEGGEFPRLKLLDFEGKPAKLPLKKNRLNYLIFWRNDAFIINSEWQRYKELVASQKGNVQFINIGIDEKFELWKEQVKTVGFPGINLFISKDDEVYKKYFRNLKSRHYFLVDENGIIIDSNGPDPRNAEKVFTQYKTTLKSNWLQIVLISIALSGLITLIAVAIIKRNARRKAKIESIRQQLKEVELKAIKSQMNPHFLFNSLNSIQSMINQGNVENANIYLSKFASLLRAVLKNSEHEFIPLQEEIENTKLYCELEKLRFNFDFTMEVAPRIDLYNTLFPPLLMQPYIENAILHGLHPKNGEKKLSLEIDEINQQVYCIIRDNGIGRNSSFTGKNGTGLGMKLSSERVSVLNEKNNCDFEVQVIDLMDDEKNPSGTEVVIRFSNNLI